MNRTLHWYDYITANGRYRTEAWKINDLFPSPRGRPLSRPPKLTPHPRNVSRPFSPPRPTSVAQKRRMPAPFATKAALSTRDDGQAAHQPLRLAGHRPGLE